MLKTCLSLLLLGSYFSNAQTLGEDILNLVDDAVWYADKYVTPATDGAVYMASSGWMVSPKKRKPWEFTLGIHNNLFLSPQKDKNFQISNSDFKFFSIKNATTATVPSSIGDNTYVELIGTLHLGGTDTESIRTTTPEGVNQEVTYYAYIQGALSLGYGTEVIAKYCPKIHLEHADFQVYGAGLQHNIDQYFPRLQKHKFNLAALVFYSYEELENTFLTIKSDEVNFGINNILGKIDTYQFQINASKEFKKFEFMGGMMLNISDFKYYLDGEDGNIPFKFNELSFKEYLNQQMEKNYKTKTNFIGEVSSRYNLYKGLYVQSVFGFGKFINGNFSVQYQF